MGEWLLDIYSPTDTISPKMCLKPFKIKDAWTGVERLVPCSHCYECVKNKRASWTARNLVEHKHSFSSYFITLTYDDEHINRLEKEEITQLYLPLKSDYQKLLKRLRKRYGELKYFLCHEYGGETFRPHYHLILYFKTEVLIKTSDIQKQWKYGFVTLDKLNQARIHYTSKYLSKATYRSGVMKLASLLSSSHPIPPEKFKDELFKRVVYDNTFIRCSTRPAIGSDALLDDKFVSYVRDYAQREGSYPSHLIDGMVYPLSKYYIHKIFTDDERALYCADYEKMYNTELRKESKRLGIHRFKLKELRSDLSDRREANLEKMLNLNKQF